MNLMKLMEEICKNIMHVVNDHWLVGANFEVFAKLTKKKKKVKIPICPLPKQLTNLAHLRTKFTVYEHDYNIALFVEKHHYTISI